MDLGPKSSIRLARKVCVRTLLPKMSLAPMSAETSVSLLADDLPNCYHITAKNEFHGDFELLLLLVCLI